MTISSHSRIFLFFTSLILVLGGSVFLHLSLESASALDCPALNLKNTPSGFVGMEVLSNTPPFQKGVRLMWKDPVDTKPVTVTILRKIPKGSFTEIGSVNGGTETYLDTSIEKRTASYLYALKNTYTCGSSNFSNYIEVPLLLERDNSEPHISLLLDSPTSQGREDPILISIRDPESGIDSASLKVEEDVSKPLTGGKIYGNASDLLWMYYPSKTQFSTGTGRTLQTTVTNLSGLVVASQDTKHPIIFHDQTNIVRFGTNPVFGTVLSPNKRLTLTWKPRSIVPDGSSYLLSSSVNGGLTWDTIQKTDKKVSSFVMESPSTIIPNFSSPTKENTLLFKVQLLGSTGDTIAYDLLALQRGQATFQLNEHIPTIFVPTGTMKIFDAYTGKSVTWPFANDTMVEVSKLWKFTDTNQGFITGMPAGYYYVKVTTNSYTFPIYAPADQEGIFEYKGATKNIDLLSDPTVYYESNRVETSSESIDIISNTLEPLLRFPYIFPEPVVVTNTNTNSSNTNSTPPEVVPLSIQTSYCTPRTLLCHDDSFTATNSSISIYYDPISSSFYSTNSAVSSTEKSLIGIPTLVERYVFTLGTSGYSIQVPRALLEESKNQSLHLFTVESTQEGTYTFTTSQEVENKAVSSQTFLYIKKANGCTSIFSSTVGTLMTPFFGLCDKNNQLSTIMPRGEPVTLSAIPVANQTPTTTAWYTPYMNIFATYKLYFQETDKDSPHTPLSRGELAYFLVKTAHIPLSSHNGYFKDLPVDHPYATALTSLQVSGIIEGVTTPEGQLVRPDTPVIRAEALKMILKTFRITEDKNTKTLLKPVVPFVDAHLDDWYYPYIDLAYSKKLIEGYTSSTGDREVRPGKEVTRAEAIKLIITALQGKL